MAESIAELAASLGIDVDKGSFDSARKELNRLAKVEMQKVIDAANAVAHATVSATAKMAAEAKKATAETSKLAKTWGWLKSGIVAFAALKVGSHLKHMAQHTIAVGANMGDLADKTGAAIEEIQELGYAAQIHGLSTEFMASTLGKLATTLDKAAKKGGEMAEPFKKAGIAIKDASGKARPAADVMADVADRLSQISEEERPAEAVKLLGKSGRELIPLLKEGSAGLEKLRQEARDLGLVMSADTVDAMDKVQKNTARLSKAWEGIKEHAIVTLIPEIKKLTESLLAWYQANKKDVAEAVHAAFKAILVVVKLLAKVLMVLVKAAAFVAKSWKALTVIALSLGAAYLIVHRNSLKAGMAMLKSGLMAAKGWIIALAPILAIGAAIAGVILLVEDFMSWMRGDDSLLGRKFGKFEDNAWAKGIAKVFEAITDIVKWLVDKVEWLLNKAMAVYNFITNDDLEKSTEASNVFSSAQTQVTRLGKEREDVIERLRADPTNKALMEQARMLGQHYAAAVEQRDVAAKAANIKIDNTINITGDPGEVRRIVEQEMGHQARYIQAIVGGAK